MTKMTWTHNMCFECWKFRKGNREPVRVTDTRIKKCCFCGKENKDGIYVKHDPKELHCIHDS